MTVQAKLNSPHVRVAKPTLLLDLPKELLCEITTYLEPSDLLKLRLVLPKSDDELLKSILQDLTKRLYVQPTPTSMEKFRNICESEFFQSQVTEVVWVPTSVDKQSRCNALGRVIHTLEDYTMAFDRLPQNSLKVMGYGELASRSRDHGMMERSWNLYKKLLEEEQTCIEPQRPSSFADDTISLRVSTELCTALAQLWNLKTIAVHPSIDGIGLNGNSLWHGDDFAVGRLPARAHTKGVDNALRLRLPGEPSLLEGMDDVAKLIAAILIRDLELSEGIDVFLHAFTQLEGQVQELRLGEQSPNFLPASIQQENCVPDDIFQAALSSVSSLTVSCRHEMWEEDSNRCRAGADIQWMNFFSTATNLKSLTVYVNPGAGDYRGVTSDEGPIVFDIMLLRGHLPKLRHLELAGPKITPEPLLSAHFMPFITRHSATLRTVKLRDLLLISEINHDPAPTTSSTPAPAAPAAGAKVQRKKGPKGKVEEKVKANNVGSDRISESFRTCLKSLRMHFNNPSSKLKEVSIEIPYRDGSCRCEHYCAASISGTDVMDAYTLGCGCCTGSWAGVKCSENYQISRYRWIQRSELEALAQELGIAKENDGWDFGRYVMRAK